MARALARQLQCALVASRVSRLLFDLNRSIGHRDLFSEVTGKVSGDARDEIVRRYYLPYRAEAEQRVSQAVSRGRRVIHLSSHSFTPKFHGQVRADDVGLL